MIRRFLEMRAFTGGGKRIVNHPSYQAYAYAAFIRNSSEQVQDEHIGIAPCAYLHNCSPENRAPLDDDIYKVWTKEAPLFDKSQVLHLREYIKRFITRKSVHGDLLYKMNLHPHAVLSRVLWRWYQNASGL